MLKFNTLLKDSGIESCRLVSYANWIINYSTDDWRQSHLDLYAQATMWRDLHFNDPDLLKLYNECERLIYNRKQRSKRMNAFAKSAILTHDCCMVTITFNDDALSSTNVKTRRQRVNEFLLAQSPCYVFNVDYGAKSGREHYHAILVGQQMIDAKKWPYGAVKGIPVRNTVKDSEKVSKYINKITNHSTKGTAKPRVTYSKVKPSEVAYADWYQASIDLYKDECPF